MGENEVAKHGGAEKKAEETLESAVVVASGAKKTTDVGDEKKDSEETNTVVLRLDLHCEGCGKKVTRFVSQTEGVLTAKADCNAKKLTVMGHVDPFLLRERVEDKTKKKVELISYTHPKKGDEKSEKKTEDNKKADGVEQKLPKQDVVSTPTSVVMKIKLHCDGCAQKIKRVILKNIDGVESVSTDLQKDLVTMSGTMKVNEVVPYLKEKLKRAVDIVIPKKNDVNNDDKKGKAEESSGVEEKKTKEVSGDEKVNKQEKKNEGEGDRKKNENEGGPKSEGAMTIEVSKTEYRGHNSETYYASAMPVYSQDYGMPSSYHYQDFPTMQYYTRNPPSPPSPTPLPTTHQTTFGDETEHPSGCYIL